MPSFEIQDSVAFVTGTNKKNGIGRAIVEALITNGARKVYATARNVDQLNDLVQAYPTGKVVPVALDVTDLVKIEKLASEYHDVTLVVNNAGYFGAVSSLDDLQVAQTEIAVNYIAPMAIVKSFAPVLKQSSLPTAVVNVNSIASLINFPLGATYSASKAATHSLTQAQRRDLPSSLVIGVYPGPIDTDMAEKIDMEKVSAAVVADQVVDALGVGTEDVFPDPMAQQMAEGWKSDAKAMEQQMVQMAQASQMQSVET